MPTTSYLTPTYLAFNSNGVGTAGTQATRITATNGTITFTSTDNTSVVTLTNVSNPVNPSDAATKSYVDTFRNQVSGSNSLVQINYNGSFGANANFAYNGSSLFVYNTTASTNQTTGALVVSGGIGVLGTSYTGTVVTTLVTGLAAPTNASDATNKAYVDGFRDQVAGSNTLVQLNYNGSFGANANFAYNGSSLFVYNTTASTNQTTGALVVSGGIGVLGTSYTGTVVTTLVTGLAAPTNASDATNKAYVDGFRDQVAGSNTLVQLNYNGSFGANANFSYNASSLFVYNNTASTTESTGALVVSGGLAVSSGNVYVGANGTVNINNTTASSSIGTGALILQGGLSAAKTSYMGTVVTTLVTGLAVPINPTDASNKSYVDNLINGLAWKQPVAAATTGSITLSGTQTIDAVNVTIGQRVLVKDQSVYPAGNTANGIYIVASGAWSRSSDMALGANAGGDAMFVLAGTTNSDKGFVCTNVTPADVVGTNLLTFVQFTSVITNQAAGSDTLVQFNSSGSFGANPNFAFNGTTLSLYSNTASTTASTGALVVSGGFAVSSGNVYVGANGIVNVNNTIASTNQTTGALVVSGGIGVLGTSYTGTVVTTLVTGLGAPTNASDAANKAYVDGFRDQVAGSNTLVQLNYNGSFGANANFAYNGSSLFVYNTTASTNQTTGALVVSGGIGVLGTSYTGTVVTTLVTGLGAPTNASDATNKAYVDGFRNQVAGSNTLVQLNYNGSFGANANFAYNGSSLFVYNNTASTNASTGALVVAGGLGVYGSNVYFGTSAVVYVTATLDSTSVNSGSLIVSGGVGVGGSVTANQFNTVSDVQFKTSIERLSNSLDTINKIEGFSYNWKESYSNNNKKQFGVIAQQLEEAGLNNLVTVSETNTKAVNYIALIPLLIESTRELTKKIEKLEKAEKAEKLKIKIKNSQ